jgi:hypothetical protein
MELTELQRIVLKLANQCHVRYWIHWNHPEQQPWLMAIHLVNYSFQLDSANLNKELAEKGFTSKLCAEGIYWLIERDMNEPIFLNLETASKE